MAPRVTAGIAKGRWERFAEGAYLRSLAGNAGWLLAERVTRYAIGFAIGIMVARYLGPDQYGLLNYATAFVGTLAFLSTLGLEQAAVLTLVRDPGSRHELLGTLLLLRLAGGLVMIAVAAAVILAVPPSDCLTPVLIGLISLAQAMQAFDSIDCWFQATMQTRRSFLAKATALLSMTAVRVALVVMHAPVVAFAVVVAVESTLLAIAMLAAYARSGESVSALRPSVAALRSLVAHNWPLMASAAITTFYLRIDQVLLGYLADFRSVGMYSVASRIIEATALVPYVFTTAAFPALVRSVELGAAVLEERTQRWLDVMLWSAIALAAPLCLFAPTIVHVLVGATYDQSAQVLALLAWMPVLSFVGAVRLKWLIAQDAFGAALGLEAAACGINLLANVTLIPALGATGAALAALGSAAGATLITAVFSQRIRRSLVMYARSATAPLRLVRRLLHQS